MTDAIDLTTEQRKVLSDLLRRFLPGVAVWAYGSRVRWTARPNSDLDLVAFTTPAQRAQVADLKDALAESNLPFPVDLHVWDDVPERFREIILKEYVVVQDKQPGGKTRVPLEWQRHEVSKLLADGKLVIGDGYRAKNSELSQTGLPFARAGNINNGFQFTEADHFPSDALSRVGNKVSQPGDVVFTSKGTVGRFAFVREDTLRFVYSPQLCFWRPVDQALIQSRFLYYWMHGSEFFAQFKGVAGQTDMAEYVSLTDQRRMHITLPPLPEQRAIAHILGTLDDKIELNRRMNETLGAMARALFKSWFVDFDPIRAKAEGRETGLPEHLTNLFPDSFEDSELGKIPRGWGVGEIQDCCAQIQNGGTPKRNDPRYWVGGNIPWLASGEVRQPIVTATEGFITESGLTESSAKWVPAYSTVIALYGATAGQVSLVSSPLTTNQAVCALVPKKDFAFFNYLSMRAATSDLESKAVGSAQQNISKGIVQETQVILPPTPVIERFAMLVGPLFDQWIANLCQSRTLDALRDTLLPKLISGEVSVAGIEAESA